MAFSSFQELVNMSAKDPQKAMGMVKKAEQAKRPVVSRKNPGYGNQNPQGQQGAVQRRLRSMQTVAEKDTERLSEQNKSNGY